MTVLTSQGCSRFVKENNLNNPFRKIKCFACLPYGTQFNIGLNTSFVTKNNLSRCKLEVVYIM